MTHMLLIYPNNQRSLPGRCMLLNTRQTNMKVSRRRMTNCAESSFIINIVYASDASSIIDYIISQLIYFESF